MPNYPPINLPVIDLQSAGFREHISFSIKQKVDELSTSWHMKKPSFTNKSPVVIQNHYLEYSGTEHMYNNTISDPNIHQNHQRIV